MNKVIRTTWIILLLTVASGMARAQQGLQIASVFQKYGKQKGVTMVELSNEMLETYQMTLYKSLVFKDVEEALPTILNCLDADKKKAKKVKEVVAGGQIQSGYYQLPQLKEDVNRFILFKTGKKGSATLIYIEGELDADDLVTMLFMKKTKHYKNMKHIYLLLFMLIPMAGMAQEGISQDTTLYVNGRKILIKENEGKIKVKLYEQSSHGDTIENDQIFEGIYTDGQTTERRTAFTVPFVKRKNHYRFDPHIAGFYMGYTRLSDGINFNTPDGLNINANKSWEIGFNLFQGSLTLSRDRQWGITTGLGWGYRSFRLGNNYAFRQIDGVTGIVPGVPDEEVYTKSRLRYFYFRIPVALEWQKDSATAMLTVLYSFQPDLKRKSVMCSSRKQRSTDIKRIWTAA